MTKGYWMVHVDVADLEKFKAYATENQHAFKKYGARFLARAGRHESVEGNGRARNTIIEFPNYQAALECWRSEEYQAAKSLRDNACEIDITILEGYEGAQPSE
ncbi:MAG: DUF1330 domain-containing protein [Gammaproteobacteria bacterium]|nr:MAG: DUF1330 domain-containing protein [Gammaproteobacteria bacterium]